MEAAAYGVFMATVMGGSVLIFLAATPFVYNEDFAWSVALDRRQRVRPARCDGATRRGAG